MFPFGKDRQSKSKHRYALVSDFQCGMAEAVHYMIEILVQGFTGDKIIPSHCKSVLMNCMGSYSTRQACPVDSV